MKRKLTLTHLDSSGKARMVDVGEKPVTARSATAEGFIRVQRSTVDAIANDQTPKGDVLAAARLAGILAAKRTGELIPLCHPLPIESVSVQFDFPELVGVKNAPIDIHIRATATLTGKTGVEMEALVAVSVAALTIYDMCKAIDKSMLIHGIRVVAKSGGTSGDFVAGEFVPAKAPATRGLSKRRRS